MNNLAFETVRPTSEWVQIPMNLPASWAQTENILAMPKTQSQRILQLLQNWAEVYWKVDIQVDSQAIIVGKYRIDLTDISAHTLEQMDAINGTDLVFTRGYVVADRPPSMDLVSAEAWIILIDAIPGAGIEKRDNFLNLLGRSFDAVNDSEILYWTHEPLGEDDGQFYWALSITKDPVRLTERLRGLSLDEYDDFQMDRLLTAWGDEYIHFDTQSTWAEIGTMSSLGSLRLAK